VRVQGSGVGRRAYVAAGEVSEQRIEVASLLDTAMHKQVVLSALSCVFEEGRKKGVRAKRLPVADRSELVREVLAARLGGIELRA
jgi:hypothetical protein